MKWYVDEQLLSLQKKFHVEDESGNYIYEILSEIISIGDKTTIYDKDGNKVAYIEQQLLHLAPSYNVYIGDKYSFNIAKRLQLFKNDYDLSNGYSVKGDFMMLDFTIYDENKQEVGIISRKFISINDKYEIEIKDKSRKEIILAIIVAIANDVNSSKNSRND